MNDADVCRILGISETTLNEILDEIRYMDNKMNTYRKVVTIELIQRADGFNVASVIIPLDITHEKQPSHIVLDQIVYGADVRILVLLANCAHNLHKLDFVNEFNPYIEFKDKTWKNYNYKLHVSEFLKHVNV